MKYSLTNNKSANIYYEIVKLELHNLLIMLGKNCKKKNLNKFHVNF